MKAQRRFKQFQKLEKRLTKEALRLRDEAKSISPGAEREGLIRRAEQAETTSQMSKWLRLPGSRAPT